MNLKPEIAAALGAAAPVVELAINEMSAERLPARARWRLLQLENALCVHVEEKELAEP